MSDIKITKEENGFKIYANLIDRFNHVNFIITDPLDKQFQVSASINKYGKSGFGLIFASEEQSIRFGLLFPFLYQLSKDMFTLQNEKSFSNKRNKV